MLADLVSALVQAGVPGAAACLAEDDTEWTAAAGEAEPDGMFGIGSVTKTFVAAAVLRLGIDLDAPAHRWCALAPEDVTIRMLMDHSSGVPGNILRWAFLGARPAHSTHTSASPNGCGRRRS